MPGPRSLCNDDVDNNRRPSAHYMRFVAPSREREKGRRREMSPFSDQNYGVLRDHDDHLLRLVRLADKGDGPGMTEGKT